MRDILCFILAIATLGPGPQWAEAAEPAVLLRFDDQQELEIASVSLDDRSQLDDRSGLLIWTERNIDRWKFLNDQSNLSAAGIEEDGHFDPQLTAARRGDLAGGGGAAALGTTLLDQLVGQTVIRGEGFITPTHGGHHLSGAISIRRRKERGDTPFPPDTVTVFRSDRRLFDVTFPEGRQTIRWSEMTSVPESLSDGLEPGTYTLRFASGGSNTTFTVEDPDERDFVMQIPDALSELLGERDSALYFAVTAEHLLAMTDADGNSQPYLADVLDLAERLTEEQRGPYHRSLYSDLMSRLSGKQPSEEVADPTGIEVIDRVRQQIARSQWNTARSELQALRQVETDDHRTAGLSLLYLAVIEAEAGADQSHAQAVEQLFEEAITRLANAPAADRFRAHNNFGNFLLGRTQDRLYNHAFQAATGVSSPLLRSLLTWQQAREQYTAALQLATQLPPGQVAATQVNLARLHTLLADLLQTLNTGPDAAGFAEAEAFAAERARQLAGEAIESAAADDLTRAAAREVLAHVQFRAGHRKEAAQQSRAALTLYAGAGSLPGIESCHRMLGLCESEDGSDPLNGLLISQLVTEVLRDRVSDDEAGVSKAAFFARRAWVNEQIVSLLIERQRPVEALRFAELAKSRALQDVLSAGSVNSSSDSPGDQLDIEDVLEDWPADTVALEYFLGSESAWIFVVRNGDVSVFPLAGGEAASGEPRELIADITQFLSGMTFSAQKMLQTFRSTGQFDHSWQQKLNDLYTVLIPESVREEVAGAQTLVVVPHHVLHYFPFAALVTEPDSNLPDGLGTVQPRFLIEDGMSLTYAPSLTAWSLLRSDAGSGFTQINAVGIAQFEDASALPGVAQDLKNLKASFGGSLKQLVDGSRASESRVKQLLDQPGMLFAATHGMNVADQPLSSFLLCHRDDSADGELTSAEIFQAGVRSDLVVMSACFSGLADRSPLPGDDMFGLQRAFLHAGARTVVSGLWDVYDGTGPLLMNAFFQQLGQGQPASQALSEAQRQFIADRRAGGAKELWMHPYFWAVYTSAGSDLTHMNTSH